MAQPGTENLGPCLGAMWHGTEGLGPDPAWAKASLKFATNNLPPCAWAEGAKSALFVRAVSACCFSREVHPVGNPSTEKTL